MKEILEKWSSENGYDDFEQFCYELSGMDDLEDVKSKIIELSTYISNYERNIREKINTITF